MAGLQHRAMKNCSTSCDVDTRWAAAFQAAGIDSRLLTAEYGTA